MTDAAIQKPRWYRRIAVRLSVRALITLVLLLVGVVYKARVQREAVAAIEAAGGEVMYPWDIGVDSDPPPRWLVEQVGIEYFGPVKGVRLEDTPTDAVMPALGRLESLEYLAIVGSLVTDAGLVHLKGLHRLREFDVYRSSGSRPENVEVKVTTAGVEAFGRVCGLEVLDLREMRLKDADLAPLGRITTLEELQISSAAFTDAGLAHLKGLVNLKTLEIEAGRMTSAGLAHLRGLVRLESLTIQHSNPVESMKPSSDGRGGGIDVSDLSALSGMTRLAHLSIEQSKVADLAPLRNLGASLETLKFYDAPITDDGLAALAGMARLEELELTGSRLEGPGLVHLGHLGSLRRLTLDDTRIKDASLSHLAGLNQLRELSLSGTGVTDAALPRLSKLRRLWRLDLSGTAVTPAGVARLRAERPGLLVEL